MKIQGIKSTSFKGLNNPKLLKTLKFIGDNNALISSGVMLMAGCLVRPVATLLAPETNKKDKEYIAAKSISSALIGFGLTNAFFQPISKSLKRIGENPENFLKADTIKKLQGGAKTLSDSKAYNFLEQSIKMSSSALAVIPKAILTAALITPVVKAVFQKKDSNKNNISFKGLTDRTISKIMDSEKIQNFAIKNQNSSIVQNLMNARDVIATACFLTALNLNKKIDKNEKKPLAVNSIISTGTTVALGLGAKAALKKPMNKLIEKFKCANSDLKNIDKYVNGIKTLEAIGILGAIHYIVTPIISTFLTGKITNKVKDNEIKQK